MCQIIQCRHHNSRNRVGSAKFQVNRNEGLVVAKNVPDEDLENKFDMISDTLVPSSKLSVHPILESPSVPMII